SPASQISRFAAVQQRWQHRACRTGIVREECVFHWPPLMAKRNPLGFSTAAVLNQVELGALSVMHMRSVGDSRRQRPDGRARKGPNEGVPPFGPSRLIPRAQGG